MIAAACSAQIPQPAPFSGAAGTGGDPCITHTLAQADILGLTSPYTLVPAPGPGYIALPLSIYWRVSPVSHAYVEPDVNGPVIVWGNISNWFQAFFLYTFENTQSIRLAGLTSTSVGFVGALGPEQASGPLASAANQPIVMQLIGGDSINRGPILTASVNAAGSGYSPGDLLKAADAEVASGWGVLTVATVGAGGSVASLTVSTAGTDTAAGSAIATTYTTSGAGSGLTVNLTVQPGDGTLQITTCYKVLPQ